MSNIENLKARAEGIQTERGQGENTADRVGGLLVDMISEMQSIEGGLTTIENNYNTIINNGDKVTVTPIPFDGPSTPIAQITVGTKDETIYAPSGGSGSGDGGGGGGTTPDPDTQRQIQQLEEDIRDANELAESERERLNELLKKLDNQITDDVDEMTITAEWIRNNFTPGAVFHYEGWEDDLEAFTRRVGLWNEGEDGTVETFWSDFIQSWKRIGSSVNGVFTGPDGFSNYLTTHIDQWIQDGSVHIDLDGEYATQDDMGKIIKWLYSGLKVTVNENATWEDLISAATDPNSNTYIANVHTAVDLLTGTVTSNIASMFNNRISELYAQATEDQVKAGLFAKFKEDTDAIATIVAKATEDVSTASVATKLNNWEGGFITTSNLDGAIVSMIAKDTSDDGPVAAITAKVKDGIGTIKFEADEIHSVSQDYTIQMEKLLIGNDLDGSADKDSKVLLQTFTDENKNPLGFEFVVGSFIDDGHGGITADKNKKTNRVRMNRYYSYLRKIYTTWIQIGEDQYTADPQRIDISSTTTLRWFDHIGSADGTLIINEGQPNKYTFEVGDQVGYNGSQQMDDPAGQIQFGANGTLYITGSVSINGDLNVTGNTTHHND